MPSKSVFCIMHQKPAGHSTETPSDLLASLLQSPDCSQLLTVLQAPWLKLSANLLTTALLFLVLVVKRHACCYLLDVSPRYMICRELCRLPPTEHRAAPWTSLAHLLTCSMPAVNYPAPTSD